MTPNQDTQRSLSDAQIRGFAVCDGGGYQDPETAGWEFDAAGLLKLARAIESHLLAAPADASQPAQEQQELPPLPDEHCDCIVHIYPSALERMATNECTASVYSVAVGCPDEKSVPLYTADQMRAYATLALQSQATQPSADALIKATLEEGISRLELIANNYFTDSFKMQGNAAAIEALRALAADPQAIESIKQQVKEG